MRSNDEKASVLVSLFFAILCVVLSFEGCTSCPWPTKIFLCPTGGVCHGGHWVKLEGRWAICGICIFKVSIWLCKEESIDEGMFKIWLTLLVCVAIDSSVWCDKVCGGSSRNVLWYDLIWRWNRDVLYLHDYFNFCEWFARISKDE